MDWSETEVIQEVANHIRTHCEQYFGQTANEVRVSGCVDVDYWSIIRQYEVSTAQGKKHTVYCKWPKSRWELTSLEELALDPRASTMAQDEFDSLQCLSSIFANAAPALGVIRPLDLLTRPSAILSEGVEGGTEIFRWLRNEKGMKAPLLGLVQMVRNCGEWLAHLHKQSPAIGAANGHPGYLAELENLEAAAAVHARATGRRIFEYFEEAKRLAREDDSEPSYIAEGFEIRNFIVQDDKIYFLDPGRLLVGSRHEDLSRFVASLAVLYWGKAKLLWRPSSEDRYVRAFLDAYQEAGGRVNAAALHAHLLKEYLKHWVHGLDVLAFKAYPAPLKWIGRRVYLPGFFYRRINEELSALRYEQLLAPLSETT